MIADRDNQFFGALEIEDDKNSLWSCMKVMSTAEHKKAKETETNSVLRTKITSAIARGDVLAFKTAFRALDKSTSDLFEEFGDGIIEAGNTDMIDVLNTREASFEDFLELLKRAITLRKASMVRYIADKIITPTASSLEEALKTGDSEIIAIVAFHPDGNVDWTKMDNIFSSKHDLKTKLLIRETLCPDGDDNAEETDIQIMKAAGRAKDAQYLLEVAKSKPVGALGAAIKNDLGIKVISDMVKQGGVMPANASALASHALRLAIKYKKTEIALRYLDNSDEKTYIEVASAGMLEVLRKMKTPPVATLTAALRSSLAHFDVVDFLISRGAAVRSDWLLPAVEAGNTDVVAFLIEFPCFGARLRTRKGGGFAAELSLAVEKNNVDIATIIAAKDPESAKDPALVTIAAKNRSIAMIVLLSKLQPGAILAGLIDRAEKYDSQTFEELTKLASDADLETALRDKNVTKNGNALRIAFGEKSRRRRASSVT